MGTANALDRSVTISGGRLVGPFRRRLADRLFSSRRPKTISTPRRACRTPNRTELHQLRAPARGADADERERLERMGCDGVVLKHMWAKNPTRIDLDRKPEHHPVLGRQSADEVTRTALLQLTHMGVSIAASATASAETTPRCSA